MNNNTNIAGTDLISGFRRFSIQLEGEPIIGQHTFVPPIADINLLNGFYTPYGIISPTFMTITEYGLIGQFIKGNYSGTVKLINDNTLHTFSFTFNVQRDQ